MSKRDYPPIADYGFIADCHSGALVSKAGSIDWWHSWAAQCTFRGPYEDYVLRSALVLKGLINAPTGALVAAPTTSLPEVPGGVRNWDYRFSWVRDSSFAMDSLLEVGFTREKIRKKIERSGYDHRRGVFVQAFRHHVMDAALLLIPTVGFIAYNDERMIRTTDAVREELGKDGFLYRYPPGDDHLKGKEGVFPACSFWLVRCLAHQGRHREAQATFERALLAANDLRLFSEEFAPRTGEMLGNFPQGLTHLSLITAAVALARTA